MVKLRVDMRVHTEKFQFFNIKYHAIIEIVECESGRVAKKWSSASRLCEYTVLNINIFNVEYHAIIEIVECKSVMRIYGYSPIP